MTLDDEPVGGIAAVPGPGVEVADTDLAILRVLANQAAVALHHTFLFHAATTLRGRAEELSEAAERQARDLAARSAELDETQARLLDVLQRQGTTTSEPKQEPRSKTVPGARRSRVWR
ncbi:hypothetical protein SANTM175S_00760 [Streptomyces antimycoticus]